jgi:hypothetical protein
MGPFQGIGAGRRFLDLRICDRSTPVLRSDDRAVTSMSLGIGSRRHAQMYQVGIVERDLARKKLSFVMAVRIELAGPSVI